MFDKTVKDAVVFCAASEADDLPEEPGIYAWFLPLESDDTGDLLKLMNSLTSLSASASKATEVQGAVGQLQILLKRGPVEIEQTPSLDELNQQLNSLEIQRISRFLLVASILTTPIYVGMTINMGLRSRIKSHLRDPGEMNDANWDGSFRRRAAWVTQDSTLLQRCLVACMPMPRSSFSDSALRLFERILIRAIRPPLSRR